MKKFQVIRGFTIVELLVILAVISVLGVVLVDVFLRSLRSSDKSQILAKLQQNGQVAMDKIDRSIRTAEAVVCPKSTDRGSILMVVKEGVYSRFRFTDDSSGNGKIQLDYPQPPQDIFTDPSPEKQAVWDSFCFGTDNQNILTDLTDASSNGVSVSDGYFQKDKKSGFKDIVTVSFKISPRPDSLNARLLQPPTFQTSVEVR